MIFSAQVRPIQSIRGENVSPVLLLAAAAVAVLFLVARRFIRPAPAALADTAVHQVEWKTAYEHHPLSEGRRTHATADGWRTVAVGGLAAAEDLLDAVERAGFPESELIVLGDAVFVVRWRE
jgi:hypothetical protein